MKKGMLLQGYSLLQVGGEQTLLSITGSAIFNPKNPIFITLTPN